MCSRGLWTRVPLASCVGLLLVGQELPGLARAQIRRRGSADGRMVNHDEACTAAALDDKAAAFPPGNELSTLAPNI